MSESVPCDRATASATRSSRVLVIPPAAGCGLAVSCLRGADLSGANLIEVDLRGANLVGTWHDSTTAQAWSGVTAGQHAEWCAFPVQVPGGRLVPALPTAVLPGTLSARYFPAVIRSTLNSISSCDLGFAVVMNGTAEPFGPADGLPGV